jgi:hypothetical protein
MNLFGIKNKKQEQEQVKEVPKEIGKIGNDTNKKLMKDSKGLFIEEKTLWGRKVIPVGEQKE